MSTAGGPPALYTGADREGAQATRKPTCGVGTGRAGWDSVQDSSLRVSSPTVATRTPRERAVRLPWPTAGYVEAANVRGSRQAGTPPARARRRARDTPTLQGKGKVERLLRYAAEHLTRASRVMEPPHSPDGATRFSVAEPGPRQLRCSVLCRLAVPSACGVVEGYLCVLSRRGVADGGNRRLEACTRLCWAPGG